jgi:hypothetical protein
MNKVAVTNVDVIIPVGDELKTIPKGTVITISDYTSLSGKYLFHYNGYSGVIKKEKIEVVS